MQIISGKYRGKKLLEYYNEQTRPTKARVKESIFNVIFDMISGAAVLDLFAGTGAYGLECYSRGAKEVVLNDIDRAAVATIQRNCAAIDFNGDTLNLDFTSALEKLKNHKFDLIFLDPPYESDFGQRAINTICEYGMLELHGVIVFETERDIEEELKTQFSSLEIKAKKYGRTRVFFLKAN